MPRYMIVRKFTVTESEMPAVGRRSKEIVVHQYPQIIWEHSHVVVDDEGLVHTNCVYDAPSEEIVREHSSRVEIAEHLLLVGNEVDDAVR